MFDSGTVLVRRPGALTAMVDGETVMFDPGTGSYYALGETGTRIWGLLEKPTSVAALVAALVASFEVDDAQCRADVAAFLDQLAAAALIEVQD